ncbi:hypothetical protein AB9P05_01540 [Roseivirga sp. BDSF3-8]|uniref:hypothetical protein n=1 Tax=Roseivirga sp. BDSF3-8 TaxID=3241598 RepID=UPI003531F530
MTNKALGIFILIVIAFSCQSNNNTPQNEGAPTPQTKSLSQKTNSQQDKDATPHTKDRLDHLLLQLDPATLPLIHESGVTTYDGLYIPTDAERLSLKPYPTLGYIEIDTLIGIIQLIPGDILVPSITVLTRKGQKIDSRNLIIGSCGPDCGVECRESLIIDKGLNITLEANTLNQPRNSEGPLPDALVTVTEYLQKGKISRGGAITVGEVKILTNHPIE